MPAAFTFAGAFIGERIAAVPDTGGGRVDLIPHLAGGGRQFGMLRQHPFDGLIVTGAFALRHRLQIEQTIPHRGEYGAQPFQKPRASRAFDAGGKFIIECFAKLNLVKTLPQFFRIIAARGRA